MMMEVAIGAFYLSVNLAIIVKCFLLSLDDENK